MSALNAKKCGRTAGPRVRDPGFLLKRSRLSHPDDLAGSLTPFIIAVMEEKESASADTNGKNSPGAPFTALPLALELGYLIALPLAGFALLGRFADKFFQTSPWFLVSGVIIAAITSSWIVYKKVSKIIS